MGNLHLRPRTLNRSSLLCLHRSHYQVRLNKGQTATLNTKYKNRKENNWWMDNMKNHVSRWFGFLYIDFSIAYCVTKMLHINEWIMSIKLQTNLAVWIMIIRGKITLKLKPWISLMRGKSPGAVLQNSEPKGIDEREGKWRLKYMKRKQNSLMWTPV